MTTPTYAQYKQLSSALAGLSAETIEERLLTLFSVLASGQNPDGTPAPAQGASSVLRSQSYLVTITAGGGAQAINGTTGVIDFSTASTTDHAPVFQSAVNALDAGSGGTVAFRGQFKFATQLIVPAGVGLVGDGPLSAQPNGSSLLRGSTITSTFNGSAIVSTGSASQGGFGSFGYFENFSLLGGLGLAAQNGIEVNASVAAILDVWLVKVQVFSMGQHGILVGSAAKVWIDKCYIESCIGDGLKTTGGPTVALTNSYIFGQTGSGINTVVVSALYLASNRIWNNSQGSSAGKGLFHQGGEAIIVNNSFHNNGASGDYTANIAASAQVIPLTMTGNVFSDTRGGSAVNRHLRVSAGHSVSGVISGNTFSGQLTAAQAILVTAVTANRLIIKNNQGYNDVAGVIATPFTSGNHVGVEGLNPTGAAAPTASTAYLVCGAAVWVNSQGGTGVSITITDGGGGTVASALTSYQGVVPVGYSINWGAFSVAPTTLTVSVT